MYMHGYVGLLKNECEINNEILSGSLYIYIFFP